MVHILLNWVLVLSAPFDYESLVQLRTKALEFETLFKKPVQVFEKKEGDEVNFRIGAVNFGFELKRTVQSHSDQTHQVKAPPLDFNSDRRGIYEMNTQDLPSFFNEDHYSDGIHFEYGLFKQGEGVTVKVIISERIKQEKAYRSTEYAAQHYHPNSNNGFPLLPWATVVATLQNGKIHIVAQSVVNPQSANRGDSKFETDIFAVGQTAGGEPGEEQWTLDTSAKETLQDKLKTLRKSMNYDNIPSGEEAFWLNKIVSKVLWGPALLMLCVQDKKADFFGNSWTLLNNEYTGDGLWSRGRDWIVNKFSNM